MGRKLLIFCVLIPAVAWGQGLGGKWTGEISLVPAVGLGHLTFELSYAFLEGWEVTSESQFLGGDGWVWQEFSATGAFGFVELEGVALFGPIGPAFLYTQLSASFNLAGLDLSLYSAYVGPDIPGVYFSGGPSGGSVITAGTEFSGATAEIEVGFGARLADPGSPFTIAYTGIGTATREYPVDPFPGGLEFTYLELSFRDIPFLCCDIVLDLELSFTKAEGFDYVRFVFEDLFELCCDISFGIEAEFGVDYKKLTPKATWGGLEACLTVYGDVQFAGDTPGGWELYGVKLSCELEGCYGAEFLTAFDVAAMEDILGDVFEDDEFEYVKLTACGPACCGDTWELGITTFFRDLSGPLFGISRFLVELSVPILNNLTIAASFEIAIPAGPDLDVGWEFSF